MHELCDSNVLPVGLLFDGTSQRDVALFRQLHKGLPESESSEERHVSLLGRETPWSLAVGGSHRRHRSGIVKASRTQSSHYCGMSLPAKPQVLEQLKLSHREEQRLPQKKRSRADV